MPRAAAAIAAVTLALAGWAHAAPGSFPGSNGRIAYFYGGDVWVMNADGTGTQSLGDGLSPAWSPNGRWIAFDVSVNRNSDVWLMRPDGSGRTRVTTHAGADYFVSWSPDARFLVFTSDRGAGEDLYVIGADGTGERQLTNDPGPDWAPAWSPDGTRIAFAGNARGNLEVEIVNADGTARAPLSDHPERDYDPAWSPDGTRIAFTSERDGNANVYVMNADGLGVTQLTDDPSDDSRPSWSPDGTLIAFESTRDERTSDRDVFVMNADGSDERRLRMGAENARDVDWQPAVDLSLQLRRAGRTVVARVANLSPTTAQRVQVIFTAGKRRVVRTIGTIEPDSSRSVAVVERRRTRAVATGWHIDPNPADNRRSVRAR